MARTLDVYFHEALAGELVQDDGGQMSSQYAEDWLGKKDATPLSVGGVAISGRIDYAMLERIGGECAGAGTFIPAGEKLPEKTTITRNSHRAS